MMQLRFQKALAGLGFMLWSAPSFAATDDKGYWEVFQDGYTQWWNYLVSEVTFTYTYKPLWQNFFWGLIVFSLFFYLLEMLRPWRKDQPRFRKDFWLDAFYMFFNLFIFGLIIYSAAENVLTKAFGEFLGLLGIENLVAVQINALPTWAYVLILFFVADFIQWNIHRLLHRIPWLWEFHKVHHSVEQMGFAAHLRFHWMESIVYKSIQVIPLTMLGYNLVDLMTLHLFNLAWGHFNHSNITVNPRISGAVVGGLVGWGLGSLYAVALWQSILIPVAGIALGAVALGPVMRYLFNSPEMHIWHHAKELPEEHRYGVNFGLTLAIWDYLFGTAHVPHSGRDVELGFKGLQKFPKTFVGQVLHGWVNKGK